MNILIISPVIYPCGIGGVEIFNYNFSKELADRGNKVYILTTCNYNPTDRNISFISLNNKILLNNTLSICFHIFLRLIELRKKIDVVHIPYTSNSPLAYPMVLAKKLFNIPPYAILIHGGGMHPWKAKTIHRLFFQYAGVVIAISEIIKREYEKRCGRRIEVIAPLIPFRESRKSKGKLRIKYRFDSQDTIILFVGRIKKIKGCDILLSAFFSLGKEYIEKKKLKLLIVGGGPMKSTLVRKVDEKGFNMYVKFFGRVPHEKIPDVYRMADIYVIPSIVEGTPLSLLEAMFNGLPIIGTDTDGINNVICNEKSGLLFKKGNTDDLKEKIKNMVEKKVLRIRLGNSGKKDYFKTYNFNDIVSEHINLYRNIMKNYSIE